MTKRAEGLDGTERRLAVLAAVLWLAVACGSAWLLHDAAWQYGVVAVLADGSPARAFAQGYVTAGCDALGLVVVLLGARSLRRALLDWKRAPAAAATELAVSS